MTGDTLNRKEAIRAYKETPRPAGIYRVTHTPSGRVLLGSSPDAPAMLNRIQAQLRMRGHRDRRLQADWDSDGAEAFEFEVLDLLERPADATDDPAKELALLEELWMEKIGAADLEMYQKVR